MDGSGGQKRSLFDLSWVRMADIWGLHNAGRSSRGLRVAAWLEQYGHPWASAALILPTAAFCAALGYYRLTLVMALSTAITQAVVEPMRAMVKRPRPNPQNAPAGRYQYSFPSGHAAAAVTIYGLAAYLTWQALGASIGVLALIAALLWIGAVSAARIYLSAHWMSDVIAGWLIGLVCLVICGVLVNA